jgi:hypothetical protein
MSFFLQNANEIQKLYHATESCARDHRVTHPATLIRRCRNRIRGGGGERGGGRR